MTTYALCRERFGESCHEDSIDNILCSMDVLLEALQGADHGTMEKANNSPRSQSVCLKEDQSKAESSGTQAITGRNVAHVIEFDSEPLPSSPQTFTINTPGSSVAPSMTSSPLRQVSQNIGENLRDGVHGEVASSISMPDQGKKRARTGIKGHEKNMGSGAPERHTSVHLGSRAMDIAHMQHMKSQGNSTRTRRGSGNTCPEEAYVTTAGISIETESTAPHSMPGVACPGKPEELTSPALIRASLDIMAARRGLQGIGEPLPPAVDVDTVEPLPSSTPVGHKSSSGSSGSSPVSEAWQRRAKQQRASRMQTPEQQGGVGEMGASPFTMGMKSAHMSPGAISNLDSDGRVIFGSP